MREVKSESEGEGVRAPSQHHTYDVPQPLGISTFGLVPNHCTLDTTVVEYVREIGSGREHLARCTCARGYILCARESC